MIPGHGRNPSRTTLATGRTERSGESILLSASGSRATLFPVPPLVHGARNSIVQNARASAAFTTRGRVYGRFSTDVVNARRPAIRRSNINRGIDDRAR